MSETITLEEIYAPIEGSIEKVPQTILDILSTSNEFATDVIAYFFSGKGKLLRPALTLLGGAVKGADVTSAISPSLIKLSASHEIFHGATLIHDDIIDSAYLRRNLPTINIKWGPQTAVLVGDFLHDKALGVIHEEGSREVFSLFLKTAGEVCDGEIHELGKHGEYTLAEAEYFEIIRKKTAVLLACCLEVGARHSGASDEEARALYRFGIAFGMAFQIIDDCLDYTGNEYEFGKTLGADLQEGVITLPLIHLLAQAEESEREEIITILGSESSGGEKLQPLLKKVHECGALDYSVNRAKEFSDEARAELEIFEDNAAKDSLNKLLDYVLERKK